MGTLARWLPGLATLRDYQRGWLRHDLVAGLVLTTMLVPVGIAYAVASGLPGVYGLYATIVPLIAYALIAEPVDPEVEAVGRDAGFLRRIGRGNGADVTVVDQVREPRRVDLTDHPAADHPDAEWTAHAKANGTVAGWRRARQRVRRT
jgi:hypothetical protein